MVPSAQEIPSTGRMATVSVLPAKANRAGHWIHRRVNSQFPVRLSLPASPLPAVSARLHRVTSGGFR
jgi:hypothetical protein